MTDYATKINALLAKATSTTHQAEAETFTQAAERLMVKWGIDEAMLSDAELRNKQRAGLIVERRKYLVDNPHGKLIARFVCSWTAEGIAPVRTLVYSAYPAWWAIGYPDDLARIELYMPHVIDEARDAWKRYLRTNYADNRDRIGFFKAFAYTVKNRFLAMRTEEIAATGGAELVLASREAAVDAEFNRTHGNKKPLPGLAGSCLAAEAGRRAGLDASLYAGALE